MTGNAIENGKMEYFEVGMVYYVSKPVERRTRKCIVY